jgi:hypothetical protein
VVWRYARNCVRYGRQCQRRIENDMCGIGAQIQVQCIQSHKKDDQQLDPRRG